MYNWEKIGRNMSIITELTRMWLTRSTKRFTFRKEYDEQLPFAECDNLGLYVHIPFCKKVCNFCPYCKVIYSKETCDRYINALIQEIHIVGQQYESRKKVTSLYFGGEHRLWQQTESRRSLMQSGNILSSQKVLEWNCIRIM